MADIRLAKPAAGASETVPCEPSARFVFDFPATDATLARAGDDLNISFEDGSKLQLQDFYKEYNEENLPSFNMDGTDVTAQEFFTAMNEPDLMPAEGPGTGTVANGARFHEWGDSSLTGGIEHLNGLDWGFSRAFEWEDHPNAVGYHHDDDGDWQGVPADTEPADTKPVNHPVTLTPEHPGVVPPDTPDIPVVGQTPGSVDPAAPSDLRFISEASLRGGEAASVDGAMRVTAPDGVASIEIAGQAIWANGALVAPERIGTDEGYFHDFAYDAASGRLTYTFTLNEATQEHTRQGADSIAHSLPIVVRDVDGDSATGRLTIVIEDDVPEITVSQAQVATAVFGADDLLGVGSLRSLEVRFSGEPADDAPNAEAGVVLWAKDGLTFTNIDELAEGESAISGGLKVTRAGNDFEFSFVSETPKAGTNYGLELRITDADGDVATAGLTMTVPSFGDGGGEPGGEGGQGLHAATIVMDEGDNPEHGGEERHPEGSPEGSFTVNLNGETGTILVGGENAGYRITIAPDGQHRVEMLGEGLDEVHGIKVSLDTDAAKTLEYHADTGWTVKFSYERSEAQTHKTAEGERLDTLEGYIPLKVTDDSGNHSATGQIHVVLHDDVHRLSVSDVTTGACEMQSQHFLNFVTESTRPTDIHEDPTTPDDRWTGAAPFGDVTHEFFGDVMYGFKGSAGDAEGVKVIATSVEYHYNENGKLEYAHDANGYTRDSGLQGSLADGGRHLTTSDKGLSVGNDDASSWGGRAEIATKATGLAAEGVVLETNNTSIMYGIKVDFDQFGENDRAVLTFMLTPRNNNDDSVVYTKIVSRSDLAQEGQEQGSISIDVPDGFTKVIISAYPEDGVTPGASAHSESGFSIRSIDLNRPAVTHSGLLHLDAGADVFPGTNPMDAVKWGLSEQTKNALGVDSGEARISIHGSSADAEYSVTYQPTSHGFRLLLTGHEGESFSLAGRPLLIGTLDTETGRWEVQQFYNFEILGGTDQKLTVDFNIEDQDNDPASAQATFEVAAHVSKDRFDNTLEGTWKPEWGSNANRDDVLDEKFGTDGKNDLIYGRGGDDRLFGDAGSLDDLSEALGTQRTGYTRQLYKLLTGNDDDANIDWANASTVSRMDGTGGPDDIGGYRLHVGSISAGKIDTKLNIFERLEKFEQRENKQDGNPVGGDDALFGGTGNDMLFGMAGNDYLDGGDHKDILFGGSGNDILLYDKDDYVIHGGTGIDILLAGKNADSLEVMLAGEKYTGTPMVGGVEVLLKTMDIDHVQNLGITSQASLAKYGVRIEQNAILLAAVWGKPTIKNSYEIYEWEHKEYGTLRLEIKQDGERYAIKHIGAAGEEIRLGSAGNDNLTGTDDASEIYYAGHGGDTVHAGNGADVVFGDDLVDSAKLQDLSVRSITDSPETYAGLEGKEGGDDYLYGGGGDDILFGGKGNDVLYGEEGDDKLYGGSGDDKLYGGSGDDYLNGGDGNDYLNGGDGNDLIVYDEHDVLVDGGSGIDFLLAQDAPDLNSLLTNQQAGEMPIVKNVDVLLKGDGAVSLTSMKELAEKYGLTLDKDPETGKDMLKVDMSQWDDGEGPDANGVTTWTHESGMTMETTLQNTTPDSSDEAVLVATQQMASGG